MGDIRFLAPYRRVAQATDRVAAIRALDDESLVAALAGAAMEVAEGRADAVLANVLASEAQNRARRKETILATLGEGVFEVDEDGCVTFLNSAAEALLGWRLEDVRGEPMHDLLHCATPSSVHEPHEACNLEEALHTRSVVRHDDDRFTRKDGSMFPVDYTAAPIIREGDVEGVVVVFRDITDLKRAQDRLEEARRLRERILDAAGEGIYGLDAEGRATFVNPSAAKLLGWDAEDMLGERVHELTHHSHPDGQPYPGDECPIYAAFHDGRVHARDDEVFWRKDGSPLPVHYTSTPIRTDGRLTGAVVVFHDISERKRAEEYRAIRHAVTELLAVGNSAEEVAPELLGVMGEGFRWDAGTFWMMDAESGALRPVAFWRAPSIDLPNFETATRSLTLRPGEGFPGRVWTRGVPEWESDLTTFDTLDTRRSEAARQDGLHAAFAFPCPNLKKPQALIEFFSQDIREPGDALLECVESLGGRIGEFIGRKRSEVRMREARNLLESVVEGTSALMWVKDRDLRFVLLNDAGARAMGQPADAFIGKTLEEATGCAPDPTIEREDRAVIEHGETRTSEINVQADGERRFYHSVKSPWRDSDGNIIGLIGVSRDITERKRAEEKLRRSEERYRALYEETPVIAFTVDSEGTVQSANRYGAHYLGYEVAELVGKPLVSVFHPEDREKIRAQIDLFFENPEGTVSRWEARKVRKDGSVLWVSDVIRGMPAPSGGTHALVSCLDISDVKGAEQELLASKAELERRVAERTREIQLANQELEAFSYSVSHDLRAPLRGIETFATILEEEYGHRLDDEGREVVGRLRRESERATGLVRDLLALSRATRSEIRYETVDLSALVGEILTDLRSSDPDRPLELSIQGGVTAEGDPRLLRQLLMNLLDNAWKYTRREPVARIEFGARQNDGERVFFVRDNGVGFDLDDAQGLFQAFKRLHSPAEFEGTGIGLAIVHRIAQRHGGRVWAETQPGAGATFYFTLPQPTRSALESVHR